MSATPAATALFEALTGPAFASLPASLLRLHRAATPEVWHGAADIRRGPGWLARLCGWATGLPPAQSGAALRVEIAPDAAGETWTRHFGPHPMRSRLWAQDGLLCERLGLVRFGFALHVADGALHWRVRRVAALGLPLPASWFAGVWARESQDASGRYRFEVSARLPLAGDLVHYAGWLDVR